MAVPVDDPELGRFCWDDHGRGCWLGGIDLPPGNAAYLSVRLGAEQRDAVLPLARAAAAKARIWEPEARRFAAAELLGATDPAMAQRAADRMELCEVRVNPDGGLELSYDGTDLIPQEFIVWLEPDGWRGVSVIDQEH